MKKTILINTKDWIWTGYYQTRNTVSLRKYQSSKINKKQVWIKLIENEIHLSTLIPYFEDPTEHISVNRKTEETKFEPETKIENATIHPSTSPQSKVKHKKYSQTGYTLHWDPTIRRPSWPQNWFVLILSNGLQQSQTSLSWWLPYIKSLPNKFAQKYV